MNLQTIRTAHSVVLPPKRVRKRCGQPQPLRHRMNALRREPQTVDVGGTHTRRRGVCHIGGVLLQDLRRVLRQCRRHRMQRRIAHIAAEHCKSIGCLLCCFRLRPHCLLHHRHRSLLHQHQIIPVYDLLM